MDVYVPIARGDQDKVETEWWVKDDLDLAPGTEGRIAVYGLGPMAKVFDVVGAEQTFGKLLVPAGAVVIDCHEENGVGYVDYRLTGSPIVPILLAVAAVLVGLGILSFLIVSSILLSKVNPTMFSWQLWLLVIAVIAAIFLVIILVARKGRMQVGKGGMTVGK